MPKRPVIPHQNLLMTMLVMVISAAVVFAAPETAERTLKIDNAKKLEVRHSMIGYRDTLLFYTFGSQKAVLRLHIENKTEPFKVTGIVYLFAPETSEEDLEKWLNNQHSDGLFPDIPEPVQTVKLPEKTCSVIASEDLGEKKQEHSGERFRDYKVKLSVKAHEAKGIFKLQKFEDVTGVYVKQTDS